MEFTVEFYETAGGRSPVREFLLELKASVVAAQRLEPAQAAGDASVVDEGVELAELALRGREELGDGTLVGDVGLDGDRSSAGPLDLAREAAGSRLVGAVVDGHGISASGREPRDRGADAASGTGDDEGLHRRGVQSLCERSLRERRSSRAARPL